MPGRACSRRGRHDPPVRRHVQKGGEEDERKALRTMAPTLFVCHTECDVGNRMGWPRRDRETAGPASSGRENAFMSTTVDSAVASRAIAHLVEQHSPRGLRVGWLMIASIFIESGGVRLQRVHGSAGHLGRNPVPVRSTHRPERRGLGAS